MYSTSSAVTYTSVYTDSEPRRVFWGADEELSDEGSMRVIVYRYDGLPMLPVAPPSPDYKPGPEEPQTPPIPQDKDEHELMFIQPHDPDLMPEPIYPEYIPLEDEHILLAKKQPLPPIVSPTAESPGYVAESDPEEDPKEYEEDETRMVHLLPHLREQIPSYHHPPLTPLPLELGLLTDRRLPYPFHQRHRCMAPATLPSPLLPPSLYPPPVDRRDYILESEQPPSKRLCLSTLGSRYEVRESSTRGRGVDYGFADAVEAEMRHREKVNTRVTALAELHEHDTHDLYALLEDAQDGDSMDRGGGGLSCPRGLGSFGREMVDMQAELLALRGQPRRAGQQVMASVTRQGHNPPPPNTDTPPNHITSESVQAMIDQALLRNFTNGDGSQSSHEDNPRHSDQDFRSRGLCNDLGSTQEEDDRQVLFPGELKKLEIELWNLKVKGNDVPTYTNRFQELTLICTKFVANENKKIDKYINGLPDNIYGNVKSSKPRTLDETIELENDLMDQKLRTYAEKADNKKKTDDTSRNNNGNQQQHFKKQNVTKVYNMGTGERKPYEGSLPKCTKCQRHHNGPCSQKCHKCNKVGHFARDCRSSGNANVSNTQRDGKGTPKGNGCFKCGALGHFKRDCPKLKNKNGGNRSAQG
nr:hypothetical protein [Tanacetum cinerariifolium]